METTPYKMRPNGLTIVCALSFIGTCLSAFSNLFVYFYYNVIPTLVNLEMFGNLYVEAFDFIFSIKRVYYLFTGLLNISTFIGVCFLWKMRRAGLHIYAITQILILIVSTVYLYQPMNASPFSDLLLTLIFILLYLRYRKVMD